MKFAILIVTLFILTGCFLIPVEKDPVLAVINETIEPDVVLENETLMPEETPETVLGLEQTNQTNQTGCTDNSECVWEEQCIDGSCGKITELYETEGCDIKCNFDNIEIETSDGDLFTLSRGKGDYTGGGAIEWVVSSGDDYCQGEEIIIPVKIIKKNYGKMISEEYVTVGVGEASQIITHPTSSIEFTFEILSVEETCG